MKNTALIIPAGGIGKRLGVETPKQYIEIAGVPIIIRTIKNFEHFDCINVCVVAAHPDRHEFICEKAEQFKVKIPVVCVPNGKERIFSVYNALESEYCSESEFVLIHDAVRPFADSALVKSIVKELAGNDAVIPVLKPKDTIKLLDDDGMVIRTLDREHLCMVQTPQAFRTSSILAAYKKALEVGFFGTDDASVAEFYGMAVKTVAGSSRNFKITDLNDLNEAERLVK